MSGFTKNIKCMQFIKEKDSKEFIRRYNKNIVTKEFLDSCRKAGELFGRKCDIKKDRP